MVSRRKPVARLERLIRDDAHEQAQRARTLLTGPAPPDSASIHETRKAVKRLRAILALVRSELGGEYDHWTRRLRDLNRRLSSVRDLDACLKLLADFRSECSLSQQFIINQFQAELTDQRTLCAAAGGSAWRQSLVDELDAVTHGFSAWHPSATGFDLIEPALRSLGRRARRLIRQLGDETHADAVHALRKLVKWRMYWLEMLEPLWPRGLRAEWKLVDLLADQLGDHHDLVVLRDLLQKSAVAQQAANPQAVQSLQRRLMSRQKKLESRALRLAGYLFAERPKAFARRWKSIWKIWRDSPSAAEALLSAENAPRPRPR